MTGVGGTYLSTIGPPPTESVWNGNEGDGMSGGAGGGGVSSLWRMPNYQSNAPAALGVVTRDSACGSVPGNCREVPDVSANAGAPVAIYCTEVACATSGWTGLAGTSVAAPTWSALFALADASSACDGIPLGFANPLLYAIAGGGGYASAFHDITSGNNDLLGAHGGLYPATGGYDLASGLGTPIAGSGTGSDNGLVSQLCLAPRSSSFPPAASATTTTIPPPTPASPARPVVTGVSPNAGPTRGGIRVTLHGSRFTKVRTVRFGSSRAISFTRDSDTKIVAIARAGTGTVYVTVTTAGGTSQRVRSAEFSYLPIPTIKQVDPASGSRRGRTRVTLIGNGFTTVTAVRFGTVKASRPTVDSKTKIVVTSPKGSGTVYVTVTTPGGTSAETKSGEFSYR